MDHGAALLIPHELRLTAPHLNYIVPAVSAFTDLFTNHFTRTPRDLPASVQAKIHQ